METYQGMGNMLRHDRWMVSALIIAGVASSASMGGRTTLAEQPATLEEIPGSDLKRVVLTQKAAERLAIATEAVREEPVLRWTVADGKVEAVPTAQSGTDAAATVLVRVPLPDDQDQGSRHATLILSLGNQASGKDEEGRNQDPVTSMPRGTSVLPIGYNPTSTSWPAQPAEVAPRADAKAQYYEVSATGNELALGQHVQVSIYNPESSAPRKVIPYSAVLYDTHGNTWTYTNPEPLAFVRQPIDIEQIEGDLAILKQESAVDGAVVTAGAAELWGIESKFGGGH
jgi:hypothetical protein